MLTFQLDDELAKQFERLAGLANVQPDQLINNVLCNYLEDCPDTQSAECTLDDIAQGKELLLKSEAVMKGLYENFVD